MSAASEVLGRARSRPVAFQTLSPLPQKIPRAFSEAAGVSTANPLDVGAKVLSVLARGASHVKVKGLVSCSSACFESPLELLRLLVKSAASCELGAPASIPIGCCSDTNADSLPCLVRCFNQGCWEALREWQEGEWDPDTSDAMWSAVLFVDKRRDLRLVTAALIDWVVSKRHGTFADAERALRAGSHLTFLFAGPFVTRAGGPRCRFDRLSSRERDVPDLPFSLQVSTEPEERALAYGSAVGAGDRAANLVNLLRTGLLVWEGTESTSA